MHEEFVVASRVSALEKFSDYKLMFVSMILNEDAFSESATGNAVR